MTACRGIPIDVFYERALLELAREVCASCDVREECLATTMATEPKPRIGFRAGLTPQERIALAGERQQLCKWCELPVPTRRRYCDNACHWAALGELP